MAGSGTFHSNPRRRHGGHCSRLVATPAPVGRTVPIEAGKALDGKDVPIQNGGLDAGNFTAWQVKGFQLILATEGKP